MSHLILETTGVKIFNGFYLIQTKYNHGSEQGVALCIFLLP